MKIIEYYLSLFYKFTFFSYKAWSITEVEYNQIITELRSGRDIRKFSRIRFINVSFVLIIFKLTISLIVSFWLLQQLAILADTRIFYLLIVSCIFSGLLLFCLFNYLFAYSEARKKENYYLRKIKKQILATNSYSEFSFFMWGNPGYVPESKKESTDSSLNEVF